MKTVFLTTSPKKHKKWANSSYFLWLTKIFFAGKDAIWLNLGGKKDYKHIFEMCKDADMLVIAMPVYVDAIPSHILSFLEMAESESKLYNWHCKVYTVANCGFFEGVQCEFLLEQMQCWCQRAKLEYGGGLGVGAGEMLGVLRLTNVVLASLLFMVQSIMGIAISLVNQQPLFSSAFNYVSWVSIGITIGIFILYSLGLYINTFRMALALRQRKTIRNRYTTVWFCGRWLFMLYGSLFWIIRAVGNYVPVWAMFHKVPEETQLPKL